MSEAFPLEGQRARRSLLALALSVALVLTGAPVAEAFGRLVSVIVVGPSAGAAADAVTDNHGEIADVLPLIDGVVARVPATRLDDVARAALVTPDRPMRLSSDSYGAALQSVYPVEIGATDLWARGLTGEGVTVALVDTGVADVPDVRGRVVAQANFTREASPWDTYGHGTFQAGLIAGDGTSSGGRYVGIAPEASLFSVKVADATGATSLGQVLSGLQLVSASADRFDIDVLLLALDSGSPLPPELDPLSTALRRIWGSGVTVVVPAGNDGPEAGTIASPGEDPVLLTASSVNDRGTPSVDDDEVSSFSARGPTRWGAEKPDVAAPGQHLVSLRAPGSTIDHENPSARVEDGYFKGSGTSMAAAVTAGAAALLLQARPELSPDEVKAILQGTASGIAAGDADSVGAGVIDVRAAVEAPAVDALPAAPDLGPLEEPFTPPGLDFGWVQDEDGVWHWTARQWAARQWADRTWSDEEWGARQWAARQWAARQWAARQWTARQWAESDWQARQWAARQWAARQWAARQWAARQWAEDRWEARQWAARQWAGDAWDARQWAARQWAARQWSEEEWSARQWSARQWSHEQWEARQWSARQWSDEDWEARQWSARQWSARQWSDEDWSARQWSARQWSARQWSARQWSSEGWS